ncbi:MAG TPA: hypothetical protein VLV83_00040 [Acidobacteriota bacterium]|nr:hypothetical protein [Acidobacteriota bacterium]
MKLPFSFGSRLIFRLALPGLLATFFLGYPLIGLGKVFQVMPLATLDLWDEVVLGILVVFFGWLISVLDMPIYMLMEGRRYWPGWLKRWMTQHQKDRLAEYQRKASEGGSDAIEYHLKAAEFPLSKEGQRHAPYPTRLGNILTEHETYPNRKYGMDGVFYWYRIWQETDKDLRGELDERQTVLDGLIYSSAVLYLSALLSVLVLAGVWYESRVPPLRGLIWVALTVLAGYLFYRLSLPGYVQYGNHFKALFDRSYSKLDLQPQLDFIAHETGQSWVAQAKGAAAPKIVWRYLQWHTFRPQGADKNRSFEDMRKTTGAKSPSKLNSGKVQGPGGLS